MMGILAAVEGVCDTPLHLFDHLMDNMMVDDGHPRCRGARMRYAPTPIRQFHRLYDGFITKTKSPRGYGLFRSHAAMNDVMW